MIPSNLSKIKQSLKQAFPFIKYRWRIYAFFLAVKHFIYYRSQEIVCQKDLSQIINIGNHKLEIEPINETNKNTLREFVEKNYNKNMYKNWPEYFYKNNYKGFIAMLYGKIIGYIWWWNNDNSMKPPPEIIFYNIKLDKDNVYMFNFFIAPQYRGGGNAIEFMTRVFSELKKLGYNWTTGIVGPNYLPARWTYNIVGYKDIKTITGRHIFFGRIAYLEKAIFIKNSPMHHYHPFEHRLLFSFRNKI